MHASLYQKIILKQLRCHDAFKTIHFIKIVFIPGPLEHIKEHLWR